MMVAFLYNKETLQGYMEKNKANGESIATKVRLTLKKVCLDTRKHFMMQCLASFILFLKLKKTL